MKKSVWHRDFLGNNGTVLALFTLLVHLRYARTWQSGFVTDFTGFLHRIDGATLHGVWDCFGFPALHQVTNLFLFCFVQWFGVGGIGWYLVFTSLHIANAFLGFLLAKKIFEKNGHAQSLTPALMASLLFLLSPYQAEVVVWRVCFNFLFCTLTMLGSLLLLVKYWEKKQQRHLLGSLGLFVVALLTFELAVALPLLVVGLLPLTRPRPPKGEPTDAHSEFNLHFSKFRRMGVRGFPFRGQGQVPGLLIALPFLLLTVAYFFFNRILLGGWAGHYGEGVHLNFDLHLIAANCGKYFTKYLLWWREWPHNSKEALVLFFEWPVVAWGGLAAGLGALTTLVFYKKTPSKLRLAGHAWLLFFLALSPVANLYVAYILHGENDRYGYLASLFFCIGLVAVFDLFPRLMRNGLFALWLAASVFFLHKMTVRWQVGAQIANGLLRDFRWHDAPAVYILASPDNYQGIPIFKDFSRENLAIKHALRYLSERPAAGDFYQVSQFNLTTPNDGFTAYRDSATGVFHLKFNQWGNWWWLYGMGLGDYQTEHYRFRTEENACRIEMKQWPPIPIAIGKEVVFIVAQGDRWQEL